MKFARAPRQMNIRSKQALHVNLDKFDCVMKRGCMFSETSLIVFRNKYTRGSRIISQAYDSRTLRTKRTIESSQNFLIQIGI